MDSLLFLIFAALAVGCGVNVVLRRHPVSSALALIGVMGSLAVLYLLLGAQFIAAVQVIVYAGAIMVLFLIVIMLLNAGAEQRAGVSQMARYLGLPLVAALGGTMAYVMLRGVPTSRTVKFGEFTLGGARPIGEALFTKYLLPFEISSVLVLIAIAGAVVLAYKEFER